jgi:hypothetical protein
MISPAAKPLPSSANAVLETGPAGPTFDGALRARGASPRPGTSFPFPFGLPTAPRLPKARHFVTQIVGRPFPFFGSPEPLKYAVVSVSEQGVTTRIYPFGLDGAGLQAARHSLPSRDPGTLPTLKGPDNGLAALTAEGQRRGSIQFPILEPHPEDGAGAAGAASSLSGGAH